MSYFGVLRLLCVFRSCFDCLCWLNTIFLHVRLVLTTSFLIISKFVCSLLSDVLNIFLEHLEVSKHVFVNKSNNTFVGCISKTIKSRTYSKLLKCQELKKHVTVSQISTIVNTTHTFKNKQLFVHFRIFQHFIFQQFMKHWKYTCQKQAHIKHRTIKQHAILTQIMNILKQSGGSRVCRGWATRGSWVGRGWVAGGQKTKTQNRKIKNKQS